MTTSPSGYGTTPEGFVRPSFYELRQTAIDNINALLSKKGLNQKINPGSNSNAGMLLDLTAYIVSDLFEVLEGVYLSAYPATANGVALDHAVSYYGMKRSGAFLGRAILFCYGSEGATIPMGSLIMNQSTGTQYRTDYNVTVKADACSDVVLVPTVKSNEKYIIRINGAPRTYTSSGSATMAEVIAGLAACLSVKWMTATSDGSGLRIRIYMNTGTFSISTSDNIMLKDIASPVTLTMTQPVNEIASPGSITKFISKVPANITRIENPGVGFSGKGADVDHDLRIKYQSQIYKLGSSTAHAIHSRIESADIGVSYARVYENTSNETDMYGVPAHSIHCVIEGGDDVSVATCILNSKPAGVGTWGETMVGVLDSQGIPKAILFDRPKYKHVWVKCAVTQMPQTDEVYAPSGPIEVATAIAKKGNSFGIGIDVALQRLIGAATGVTGVERVSLSVAVTDSLDIIPSDTDYTFNDISIGYMEVPTFDVSRIIMY